MESATDLEPDVSILTSEQVTSQYTGESRGIVEARELAQFIEQIPE